MIAVAGSPEKLAAARAHGADELVNYGQQDLRGAILGLTEGRGADVCLDAVGGGAFDAMSRVMARSGRLLVLGFASGRIPILPVNLLLLKGYEVVGVYWKNFVHDEPAVKRRNAAHLAQLWREGHLKPVVSASYPLHRVAQALHDNSGRDVIGKLVVSLEGVADE